MSQVARDIAFESLVVPFAVAALATLAARLFPERHRATVAGAAVALAFVAAYVSVRGVPAVPPRGAAEKLPLLVLAAWAAGALLEARRVRRRGVWLAGLFAAALLWVAWPRLGDDPTRLAGAAALLWGAGAIGLSALGAARGGALRPMAMLAAAAIGLVGAALSGRVIYVAQLALAVAASVAAVAIGGRGGGVPNPAVGALAPAATGLLALGAVLAFYSDAAAWLLALAWLPLPAAPLGRRLARTRRREPWLFALLCAAPPALAVAIGRWLSGPLGY